MEMNSWGDGPNWPGLTEEEFTKKLSEWLQQQGIVRELQTILRHRLVTALKKSAEGDVPNLMGSGIPPAPHLQALDLLVAEHLSARNCHYSLSVLASEAPVLAALLPQPLQTPMKATVDELRFELKDLDGLVGCLGIPADSEQFKAIIKEYQDRKGPSLIGCIIRVLSRGWSQPQTDPQADPPTLDQRLLMVDQDYQTRKKPLNEDIDSHLLRMRVEMEKRRKEEVAAEVAKFKEGEESRMRIQVEAECKEELRKWREEVERSADIRVKETEARAARREEEAQRQVTGLHQQRQEVLAGMDQIRTRQEELNQKESWLQLREAQLVNKAHDLDVHRSFLTVDKGTLTDLAPEAAPVPLPVEEPSQHILQDVLMLLQKAMQKDEAPVVPAEPQLKQATVSTQAVEMRTAAVQTKMFSQSGAALQEFTHDANEGSIPNQESALRSYPFMIPSRTHLQYPQHYPEFRHQNALDPVPSINRVLNQEGSHTLSIDCGLDQGANDVQRLLNLPDQLKEIQEGIRETKQELLNAESRLKSRDVPAVVADVASAELSPTDHVLEGARERLLEIDAQKERMDQKYKTYKSGTLSHDTHYLRDNKFVSSWVQDAANRSRGERVADFNDAASPGMSREGWPRHWKEGERTRRPRPPAAKPHLSYTKLHPEESQIDEELDAEEKQHEAQVVWDEASFERPGTARSDVTRPQSDRRGNRQIREQNFSEAQKARSSGYKSNPEMEVAQRQPSSAEPTMNRNRMQYPSEKPLQSSESEGGKSDTADKSHGVLQLTRGHEREESQLQPPTDTFQPPEPPQFDADKPAAPPLNLYFEAAQPLREEQNRTEAYWTPATRDSSPPKLVAKSPEPIVVDLDAAWKKTAASPTISSKSDASSISARAQRSGAIFKSKVTLTDNRPAKDSSSSSTSHKISFGGNNGSTDDGW